MPWHLLAFSLGVVSLLLFSTLPQALSMWVSVMLSIALSTCALKRYRYISVLVIVFSVGMLYAIFVIHMQQQHVLDDAYAQKPFTLDVIIDSFVEDNTLGKRFIAKVLSWSAPSPLMIQRVRLNWVQDPPDIYPGERWRLRVLLKPPHGYANPGGFDQEKQYFSRGIHATGTVKSGVKLTAVTHTGYHYWRYRFIRYLREVLRDLPHAGMILALIAGERLDMSPNNYQILTATGTNHLMAISGLHVGLVASFSFLLIKKLWCLCARGCLLVPAQTLARVGAILLAALYAAIAGFSPPTTRALIMITCVLGGALLKRHSRILDRLVLAFALILLLDPLAMLSVGFWLSFIAVASLLYVSVSIASSGIRQWLSLQWRLSLVLIPSTLYFFNQTSLIAATCNLFAIPWVSFIVLPLALLGMVLSLLSQQLAAMLFYLASLSLDGCWRLLTTMAHFDYAVWYHPFTARWQVLCCGVAVLLWTLPRCTPGKYLSLLWLLPVILSQSSQLKSGEVRVTTLDVGQGLALVVQTAGHTLLFDTGPAWPPFFDAGEAIVNPYLRYMGIRTLDTVVISHSDMDHLGGLASVARAHRIAEIYSSEPLTDWPQGSICQAHQAWQWDGVYFEFVSPTRAYRKRNNRSCALLIDNGLYRVLIPGDMEKQAEWDMVAAFGDVLSADVIIAPHHGSRTSSSYTLLYTIMPKWVIYPVAFHNRFHFPAKSIDARYQSLPSTTLATSDEGAIEMHLPLSGEGISWSTYRQSQRKWWHYRRKLAFAT